MPLRLSPESHHFVPDYLQREREKIFQPFEVTVLLVKQDQDFLRQVLGGIPL
jgi:hypothetical protein